MSPEDAFWETKSLGELTKKQWELLCDGCGRCCLQKLEKKTTGKVSFTAVACYLLDIQTCRCRAYKERTRLVKDCLLLAPETIYGRWLPQSCAYRRLAGGKPLARWHPLLSGNPDSVHDAGISVRDLAISEEYIHPEDLGNYIITGNEF